jgi:regulator of protease activity HflC (stomatin/prohibitin superfamily)
VFDRLWEILAGIWHDLLPCVVIHPAQNGGRLRLGVYTETLTNENGVRGTGLHWKIPFVDEINLQNVSFTTMRLPPQPLTTKDGKSVSIGVVVGYSIKDVKPYICKCTDQKDALIDVTMGAVRKQVMEHTWEELCLNPPEPEVATAVRRRANRFGFDIDAVTFHTFVKSRSLHLVQPHPLELAN